MAIQRSVNLAAHPHTSGAPVRAITVEIDRPAPDRLGLTYVLSGDVGRIRIPPQAQHERGDDLWKHTCFEVFCRDDDGYSEFNFSPSLQWAAYRFDGYRSGMRLLDEQPLIGWTVKTTETFTLSASVRLPPRPMRLAVSAVVEDIEGMKSYWALKHAGGEPDFHHADNFALELA